MKTKLLWTAIVGMFAAGLLGACHGDHAAPTAAPQSTSSIDTAQVLMLAQQHSETDAPRVVDGGAVTLNDTSDTARPIAINSM